jgi:hypothetical protein
MKANLSVIATQYQPVALKRNRKNEGVENNDVMAKQS